MATDAENQEAIADDAESLNEKYIELSKEYKQTSNVQLLEQGLRLIQQAVERTASGPLARSELRASHLNNLGRCLRLLYEALGQTSRLDEAVDAGRLSLATAPVSSTVRSICYTTLSDTLQQRYFAKGAESRKDFEEALEMARAAVASSGKESKYHDCAHSSLASMLGLYFECIDSDDKYLNEAIRINEYLVNKAAISDDAYGSYVYNLAGDLTSRYRRYGRIEDLELATDHYKIAINAFPLGHTNYHMAVRSFAQNVVIRAEATNQPEGLEDALQALLSLEPHVKNNTELARIWHTKSSLYGQKYDMFSTLDDLHMAVVSADAAFNLLPSESSLRGPILERLSNALAARAETRLSRSDIDAAIDCAKQALEIGSGVPARQSGAYTTLGNRFAIKFEMFGGLQDLSESLNARRNALKLLPVDHKDRPTRLHAVANSLRTHFEHSGNIGQLEESIAVSREAEVNVGRGDPDRSMILDGLSHSLKMRSEHTGNSQDLDEAIIAAEAAVAGSPVSSASRPAYLNGLSQRLQARFYMSGNIADLDRAIEIISEAILRTPEGSSSESIYLNTLSNILSSRYLAKGDVSDLDLSIQNCRKAIAKTSVSSTFRISYLHNLGLRIQRKYYRSSDKEERHAYLREAHDLAVKCVNGTPEGHPGMADYLTELATSQLYLGQFMDPGDEPKLLAQLKLSGSTFERAFRERYATPLTRIRAGQFAGYIFMQLKDWSAASVVLSETVELFQQRSPLSLDESDRQRQLHGLSGISSLACAAFVTLDNPEAGFQILEAGRGIMANIAMGYHSDLLQVKDIDPELHAQYISLRETISRPLHASGSGWSHGQDIVAKRNVQVGKLEEVEKLIRSLPGLDAFNQRPSPQELRNLASHGPLVSFCTVDQRCDAMIVTTAEIQALPLPQLELSQIKARIGMVVSASRLSTMLPSERGIANKRMRALLRWLWNVAVQPVLEHLGLLKSTDSVPKTRLFWVTSGPLGLFPLHAAGKGYTLPLQNAYAHVISSYIPSVSALAFARRCQARVDTKLSNMALVTMPRTAGGFAPLSTRSEVTAIQEAFAASHASEESSISASQLIELCQPSAGEVLHQVRSGNVNLLHLACHAEPDLTDPSNTSLLFGSDPDAPEPDPLTVQELRRVEGSSRLDQRPLRLAYLSACCTAQQYVMNLIDENIHLAASFQLSGFPAVIGTLWEADDVAAVVIAKAFYAELFRLDRVSRTSSVSSDSGDNIARALDVASAACRQRDVIRGNASDDVLAWAAFVHIGA
ncbi:hypothetical protein NA57DRAFT_76901 [Rhizodiscina lignyota]|uniref:CHAT domain-containing protein n=1 Tax=Rhizodiscina lignyota TaxID=1504668 RepID=A0A9P4IA78_9PEZI|nr:hypothetical protein NA57DRAFT_76901 [Rhizodiscina lignyota]